jgi:hypothetical protein
MCTAPLSKRFTSRPKTNFDEKLAAGRQPSLSDCRSASYTSLDPIPVATNTCRKVHHCRALAGKCAAAVPRGRACFIATALRVNTPTTGRLRFSPLVAAVKYVVRPEIAKSKKGRVVPIGTTRLRTLLEWLRVGPNHQPLPDDRLVFLRESGETVKSFRTA